MPLVRKESIEMPKTNYSLYKKLKKSYIYSE
jgi:hypothetical protein